MAGFKLVLLCLAACLWHVDAFATPAPLLSPRPAPRWRLHWKQTVKMEQGAGKQQLPAPVAKVSPASTWLKKKLLSGAALVLVSIFSPPSARGSSCTFGSDRVSSPAEDTHELARRDVSLAWTVPRVECKLVYDDAPFIFQVERQKAARNLEDPKAKRDPETELMGTAIVAGASCALVTVVVRNEPNVTAGKLLGFMKQDNVTAEKLLDWGESSHSARQLLRGVISLANLPGEVVKQVLRPFPLSFSPAVSAAASGFMKQVPSSVTSFTAPGKRSNRENTKIDAVLDKPAAVAPYSSGAEAYHARHWRDFQSSSATVAPAAPQEAPKLKQKPKPKGFAPTPAAKEAPKSKPKQVQQPRSDDITVAQAENMFKTFDAFLNKTVSAEALKPADKKEAPKSAAKEAPKSKLEQVQQPRIDDITEAKAENMFKTFDAFLNQAGKAATDAAEVAMPILQKVASDAGATAAAVAAQVQADRPLERGMDMLQELTADWREQGEETNVDLNPGLLTFPQRTSTTAISSSATIPGLKKGLPKTNQDLAFVSVLPSTGIEAYLVFDGHGVNGDKLVKWLQQTLPPELDNALALASGAGDEGGGGYMDAITKVFVKLDADAAGALGTITGDGRHSTMYKSGASATIALYKGGQLLVAGLGDTRAILGGPQKSSKIRVMTSTHSPSEPKEKQRIEQSGGQVRVITKEGPESTRFPEIVQRESIFPAAARVCVAGEWSPGLAVSRAFGDYYAKKLGVSVLPEFKAAVTGGWKRPQNTTGQVLIIASDGVWDVMDNQEARKDYQRSPI